MKLPSYFTLIKVNEICCDCQLVFTFLLFNQLIAAAELTEWMIFWFLCTSMSCVILTDIHWALKGCSEFSLIFFFFWSQWDFSIEFQGSWIKPALRASLNTTAAVCDFSPSLFLNLFSLHGGALLWFFPWTLLVSPGHRWCRDHTPSNAVPPEMAGGVPGDAVQASKHCPPCWQQSPGEEAASWLPAWTSEINGQ